MKSLYTLAILALTWGLVLGQVVELTNENFEETIKGKDAFVKFYAPWCGHCKNMAPAYEQVGESFAKHKDVVIAKVDADKHRDLGSKYGVQGFPTLKFFPKGSSTPEDYEGGREAEDIINFVNGKAGTNVRIKKAPSSVVDLDSSNFDSIVLDNSKDVLVEFYAPWCGHCKKLIPDYEKLANAFAGDANVVVAKIDADKHKEIGSKYGVQGFPTIMWFGKDNKSPEKYERARDVESFVSFINDKAGTKRQSNGRLAETAGRIAALDAIASKAAAAGADLAALAKEAEAAIAGLTGVDATNGKYYVKVLQTMASKGKDFVVNEIARLARMMEGSVAVNKIDEFTTRHNILKAFQQ
jgi:protein disulfide-isomerase-like protein